MRQTSGPYKRRSGFHPWAGADGNTLGDHTGVAPAATASSDRALSAILRRPTSRHSGERNSGGRLMLRGAVFGKQMLDNGANHQAHRKNWLQAERDLRGTRRPSSRRRGRLLLLVILNNLIGWIAGRSDEPNIVIPLGRGLLYAEPIISRPSAVRCRSSA